MRVLITGVGGFAGGYISDYLYREGYNVIGIWRHHRPDKPFELIQLDLSATIEETFEVDAIIHTAGALPYLNRNYSDYVKDNVDSMRNLILMAERNGIKRIINLSTIGIYGEFRNEIINEESDIINPDAYGMTKYMAECLLKEQTMVDSISLRMPGIIGPKAKGIWFINTIEKMKRNEEVTIYTPDFVTKNFVWISDLAKFADTLLKASTWKYNTLVLACKSGLSIKEIIEYIRKGTNSKSKIIIDDTIRKPFCLDAQKSFEMGFSPHTIKTIIKEYMDIMT